MVSDFRTNLHRGLNGQAVAFADLFDFLRSTVGTCTNSSGVVSTAAIGKPRYDHVFEDGQWLSRGLLIEGHARTNLLRWTSDFGNSAWSRTRSSITPNAGFSTDGSTSATRLTSTAATYDGAVRQSVSYTSGDTLTFSIYAKAGDRPYVFLRERTRGLFKDTYFDLTNGVTGTVNYVHTAQIQNAGNGWYRCAITVVATQSAGTDFEIYSSEDDYDTSSTQPVYVLIWGAHLEKGHGPSSYIATQDTPVQRAGDVLSMFCGHLSDPSASVVVSLTLSGNLQIVQGTGPVSLLHWTDPSGDRIELHVEADTVTTGQLVV
ncbi:phage head spike fiber domain-containing protein [Ruegeria arenilitoris]|uniref:phage head spike fiber domain-containing protein n=1 Tax=Ruegeria arenilitoris TaxID=1173585 RepID=UPI00147D6ECA|nr:hypothetical protein [Ruegeria arenilitoris]